MKYIEWTDDATGLPCRAVLSDPIPIIGAFYCGYVGVPVGHRLHGDPYDQVNVRVHGGLTYADLHKRRLSDAPGTDGLWWFGFDCAHADDRDDPKDEAFVRAECATLAAQLMERAEPASPNGLTDPAADVGVVRIEGRIVCGKAAE